MGVDGRWDMGYGKGKGFKKEKIEEGVRGKRKCRKWKRKGKDGRIE